MSVPVFRFLVFGILMIIFRVLINLQSDAFFSKLEEEEPDFEKRENIRPGKKLFFEPKDIQVAEVLKDRADINADLITQLNRLVAALSCFLVLYTVWMIQRVSHGNWPRYWRKQTRNIPGFGHSKYSIYQCRKRYGSWQLPPHNFFLDRGVNKKHFLENVCFGIKKSHGLKNILLAI